MTDLTTLGLGFLWFCLVLGTAGYIGQRLGWWD